MSSPVKRRSPSQASSIADQPISEDGLAKICGDIWRRAVLRLRYTMIGAGIERCGKAEAAGDLTRPVGEGRSPYIFVVTMRRKCWRRAPAAGRWRR